MQRMLGPCIRVISGGQGGVEGACGRGLPNTEERGALLPVLAHFILGCGHRYGGQSHLNVLITVCVLLLLPPRKELPDVWPL